MVKRKASKAKIAANNRYKLKTYDSITLSVPKGRKADIADRAANMRLSVNAYIVMLICNDMKVSTGWKKTVQNQLSLFDP